MKYLLITLMLINMWNFTVSMNLLKKTKKIETINSELIKNTESFQSKIFDELNDISKHLKGRR